MADPCCDTIIGGKIKIVMADRVYHAIGDVDIDPTTTEREASAASDGRMYVTEKARLARARITFADYCDADPLDIYNARCKVDITVVEESRGFRHMFTGASVVGTVTKNLSSGEVAGIEIATDKYSKV